MKQPKLTRKGGPPTNPHKTTILKMLSQGKSQTEIATNLGISKHTVRSTKYRAKQKQELGRAGPSKQWTQAYEKTHKGFLMRAYRNMQSRVTGVQHLKAHLYKGKTLLSRDKFYEWAMASKQFLKLFNIWTAAGHDRRLCPSVNRINSSLGYTLDNMEWLTHSQNSADGAVSQARKNQELKAIYALAGVHHE